MLALLKSAVVSSICIFKQSLELERGELVIWQTKNGCAPYLIINERRRRNNISSGELNICSIPVAHMSK